MTDNIDVTRKQLAAVLADLADVVDRIDAEQLDLATPCADWTVEEARGHVVQWLTIFATGYADPDGKADPALQTPVEGSGGEQVRTAAAQIDSTLAAGAAERPFVLGEAEMPGELALSMILWEYQMHGWDLAAATGQAWSPDEGAVTASLAFAPGMLTPDYQGEGKAFGPAVAVAETAPPLDRLLGLSGRDPAWSA